MSASIARWQLVHFSARASGLLVSYRPVAFSSASWVAVAGALRCLSVHPSVAWGSSHLPLGPWHELQVTPSCTLYCLPWRVCGTARAWQLVQRALAVASAIFSFCAIIALLSFTSVSNALWWAS